jgi:hypothetical protein
MSGKGVVRKYIHWNYLVLAFPPGGRFTVTDDVNNETDVVGVTTARAHVCVCVCVCVCVRARA